MGSHYKLSLSCNCPLTTEAEVAVKNVNTLPEPLPAASVGREHNLELDQRHFPQCEGNKRALGQDFGSGLCSGKTCVWCFLLFCVFDAHPPGEGSQRTEAWASCEGRIQRKRMLPHMGCLRLNRPYLHLHSSTYCSSMGLPPSWAKPLMGFRLA